MLERQVRLQGENLYTEDGYEKHIYCNGSREHVLSWSTNGTRCSNKNCVVNRDSKEPRIKESIFIKQKEKKKRFFL